MPRIIRNNAIVEDDWQVLTLAEGDTPESIALPDEPVLLPLAVWLARRDEIIARTPRVGVWLNSNEGPEALAGDLDRFAVIAVNFPKFVNVRGYSTAALLRQRYAYPGEVRAVGEVLHDQLYYMSRVGFDAFALRDDKSAEHALAAGFNTFSERYQGSTDQPLPAFRRRAA